MGKQGERIDGGGRLILVRRRDVLAVGLGAVVGFAAWRLWPRRGSRLGVREQPLRFNVHPFPDVEHALGRSVVEAVRQRLRLRPEMGIPGFLHWLRIFGVPESSEFQAEATEELLSLLTNAERIEERFGQPGVIVPTEDGVRFLSRVSGAVLKVASRATHPFQELAVFGELGLPSSTLVVASSGRFTLEDAIRDCLRSLQIRETARQEPEWPTGVLAHYLPPVCSWQNRWGEELTLDGWTEFLLRRELPEYSCGGTHLLLSLALMLQADSQYPVLSLKLAQRVRDVCRRFSRMIESRQHADGAWGSDWMEGSVHKEYSSIEVHMTGHILEAQLYLPDDLRISSAHAGRALKYLAEAFLQSDDEKVLEAYCPYSHAGNVLLHCGAEVV